MSFFSIYLSVIYKFDKLIKSKIEIEGVSKNALSTFFQKSWDEARTLEEVALIMKNPSNQVGGNIRLYAGTATDGTKIKIELTGQSNNLTFSTTYPE